MKPNISYDEYIKSPKWAKRRKEKMIEAGFKCERCGSGTNLSVHHITYKNLGNEKDEDLICVCDNCHTMIHYHDLKKKKRMGIDLNSSDGKAEYAKYCISLIKKFDERYQNDAVYALSKETGFSEEMLSNMLLTSKKEKDITEIDWNARTLIAILACGKLPLDIVSADEFEDSNLRALYKALQSGKNVPEILESQPDEQSRTFVSEVLNIDTDMDDDCMMRTAQNCLRKLRIYRLEKELRAVQELLPTLPPQQQETETLHASSILKQLLELK